MGSSKKHKEKDREKRKHHKTKDKARSHSRSRSRSRERDADYDYDHRGKRSHKSSRKEKHSKRHRREYGGVQPDVKDEHIDSDVEAVTNFDPDKPSSSSKGAEVKEVSLKENSLSIELANKLRAKLGLKPLQVVESIPGLGLDEYSEKSNVEEKTSDKQKEIFVKTENISDKLEIEKFKEKLKVQREKRQNMEKLKAVKGLGESDSDEESATKWVSKTRVIEKEKEAAEKRAKLLEEMDEEFGVGNLVEEEFQTRKFYSMKDLKGLTVAHSTTSFEEGRNVILTLKDKDVLEECEDVLMNVNMVDDEKAKVNVENKKAKPAYMPYDEPEYDEFGILKKKSLLSKYDEVIDKPKQESFKIGQKDEPVSKEKQLEIVRMKLKEKQIVSLDMPNQKIASEYFTHEEMVTFKKPKKKKKFLKKSILKSSDLEPLPDEPMGMTDHGSRKSRMRVRPQEDEEDLNLIITPDSSNLIPEEEKTEQKLQEALQRRQKIKATGFSSAVKNIKTEEMDTDVSGRASGSNIILNSTAEFCRSLGELPTVRSNWDEEAEEMDFEQEFNEDQNYLEDDLKTRGVWNEVEIEDTPVEIGAVEAEPILEEEPDVSTGVAGALKLAMAKGYLDKEMNKVAGSTALSLLKAQSYTIEEKFYDDDKFGRHERYGGPTMDFKEKDYYKPDVQLEYIDDNGRVLNCKEAFRYLSHKFHGKGPAKNKIDKRMKKHDQEAKLKNMSSTDTPLRTLKLLQEKQKELHSPYVVLSGGSKALTQSSIAKPK